MSDINELTMVATAHNSTPESEANFEAQLKALVEMPPRAKQASLVHLIDAFGLKMCNLKRAARYNGKSKQSSTNNVRHVTCRRCLHTVINRATARIDELAKEKAHG